MPPGPGRAGGWGQRLGIGAFALAVMIASARGIADWRESVDDDQQCFTLHFENQTGLPASYEIDCTWFRESTFVGGPYFSAKSADFPWVTLPSFSRAVPIEGYGGPGEWLSITGERLDVRVTLRDQAQTMLYTSVELRGGAHVECRVTPDKQLEQRHGTRGAFGVSWDAE